MSNATMTLGARILANREEEKAHPLDAARKKATAIGQLSEFETIEKLYARFQKHVEDSVNAGDFPKPLRLTSEEASSLRTDIWNKHSPGPMALHLGYVLWSNLCLWAKTQELNIKWQYGHDGSGMKSWYDLCVVHPKKQ